MRPSEPGTQTTCPGPGFCAAPSHNATPPDRNRGLSPAPPPGFRRRGVACRTRVLWPALRPSQVQVGGLRSDLREQRSQRSRTQDSRLPGRVPGQADATGAACSLCLPPGSAGLHAEGRPLQQPPEGAPPPEPGSFTPSGPQRALVTHCHEFQIHGI